MAIDSDVSIIITSYNYGKYISRCLRSCLSQKIVSPEIIVVDDASTDDTDKKVVPFLSDIIYVKNDKNVGVAETSNIGVKMAKGNLFVRVDADDFINDYMIFFMRTYMLSNLDCFCVSCDYFLVDEFENKIERKYAKENNISCGIMYRKDLFLDLGGYDSRMRHREEEELRKRLGNKYKIHHLEIPFYRYRMHNNNKTKDPEYEGWKI